MKRAYLAAAGIIAVLAALSWAASVQIGDLDRLPMQWGADRRPTWYAPKWIALAFGPGIGCFAIATILAARRWDRDGARATRELLIASVFVIGGHGFYLYLLWTRLPLQPS